MKKMLMMCAVVLAAMAAFSADPLPEGGPYKEMVDGIEWTFMVDADLDASVGTESWSGTAIPTLTSGGVAIPSRLGGRPVTSIRDYAFHDCSGLTGVTIPPSVAKMGCGAFQSCSGLTSVAIPSSVTSIGNYAFRYCSGLKNVAISEGVTDIGSGAFFYCTSMTDVTIPSSMINIGYEAFCGCYNLKCVTIPFGVKSLGESSFRNCYALTSIAMAESITSIGACAFLDCTSLTEVTIPGSVERIGSKAFRGCVSLMDVVISDGVTNIESYAFSSCIGMRRVTIPSSVTEIGYEAFYNCTGLTSVNISDVAAWCGIRFGDATANPLCYAKRLFIDDLEIIDLVIPSQTTIIGDYAFYNCNGLSRVTIPSNVRSIGAGAFGHCSGVTTATISEGVTRIGYDAFYGCSGLKAVYITDVAAWCGVSFDDSAANPLCYAKNLYVDGALLTDLVVPDEVTSIGKYSFLNCTSLTSVTIPLSVTSIGCGAFCGCSGLTELSISQSVTRIGVGAFSDCTGLGEGIVIVDGCVLTVNGTYPGAVVLPFGSRLIAGGAFSGCTGLTSVMIPDGVESVGDGAFSGCSGLTSVTIPSSVTSIGADAFYYCGNLVAICFEGEPPSGMGIAFRTDDPIRYNVEYESVWLPEIERCGFTRAAPYVPGVVPLPDGGPYTETVEGIEWTFMVENGWAIVGTGTEGQTAIPSDTSGEIIIPEVLGGNLVGCITNYAFHYCQSITGVTIPSRVNRIGSYSFYECANLSSVEFPWSLKTVGEYAFYGCTQLTYMSLPDGLTNVGDYAFCGVGTYSGSFGVSFSASEVNIGASAFAGSGACYLTIPNSVKSVVIGEGAFGGSRMNSVEILADSSDIGMYAFGGCPGLTHVTIGGVTHIKEWAFVGPGWGSGSLDVVISQGEANIDDQAFYHCDNLYTVTISKDVTRVTIGREAFAECPTLAIVDISAASASVGERSFCKCTLYGGVTFSEGVTNIGNEAFYMCSDLTDVTIPASAKNIGSGAFCDCGRLTNVVVCGGVKTFGENAFSGCNAIESVCITDLVSWCASGFACESANPLYCEGNGAVLYINGVALSDLVIPETIDRIEGCCFPCCNSLTNVTMLSNVTSVGEGAFYSCTNLTSVMISSSVTNIGDRAFEWCSGLSCVVVPSSVTCVGCDAFYGCSGGFDFLGMPPVGVENAGVDPSAAIRYNREYKAQWDPVVKACGWTNAKPYDPFYPMAPVISPESGTTFDTSLTVSMTCESEGATIYYTLDGSDPTMESAKYKKFRIYDRTIVKAIAFYADGAASDMAVAEYAPGRCDDPVIMPPDGSVFEHSGQSVSIRRTAEDGVLRYTIDGSNPTADSPEYAGPFTIDESTVVKAKAFGDQYFDSNIVTATLTRVWVKLATPVITADETFTGTKNKVVMSCANEGATIYYTLDGSEPTTSSLVYSKPFCVTEGCTIKAKAVQYDYLDSDVAEKEITREWGIGQTMGKPDHSFETSGDAGFVRVVDETAALGESMQSGEIKNSQTSILSTVVVGPGKLSFKWKTSCEDDPPLHEWDHAEFVLDGDILEMLDGETDWQSVSCDITGDGPHTVIWRYVKDGSEFEGEDCLWVSEYVWESEYTETQTTGVPVPYLWLEEKCSDVVDEFESYEKVAKHKALNKRLTVEQCYVAGVDPESLTQDFTTSISMEGGFPTVTWDPDLGILREYKVWGRESLMSGDWVCPTNSTHRFFKVTVEMP